MDIPIFHLDFMGDRLLIAIIAVIHVLINHGLAVGFYPLITWFEYIAFKKGGTNAVSDPEWDQLAHRFTTVAFVITTTVGAMTGVGIWFAASLVNPASIGSLIRVFYGAWFVEWLVFVTEVVLILMYYLSWKRSNRSPEAKMRHIMLGVGLSIFSWITMTIIVSILGFMMDTGSWLTNRTFLSGFTNPIYIPQLAFRTPAAALFGGTIALFLIVIFTKRGTDIRQDALHAVCKWILIAIPFTALGAYLYYQRIPKLMIGNMQVAVTTMDFQDWYQLLLKFVIFGLLTVAIVSALTFFKPKMRIPTFFYILPVLAMMAYVGIFERIREFIRKPYVIGNYMYSNTLRKEDYPLYKRDGVLAHMTYTPVREITEENQVQAGEQVFLIACSRCHTTNGINSVIDKFENMYQLSSGQPFQPAALKAYISNIQNARYFMPPFPGNDKELDALVAYIQQIRADRRSLPGAQESGVLSIH